MMAPNTLFIEHIFFIGLLQPTVVLDLEMTIIKQLGLNKKSETHFHHGQPLGNT